MEEVSGNVSEKYSVRARNRKKMEVLRLGQVIQLREFSSRSRVDT